MTWHPIRRLTREWRDQRRGPLSPTGSTARKINRESGDRYRLRAEWRASLAERGVTPPADGFWPIALHPEDPRIEGMIRCVFEFPDHHRCSLVSQHGPKDHLDYECATIAEVDNTDPRYKSPYGPTGFVREYTPDQLEAFERNRHIIHTHSWAGGEIIHVTNMEGEANYYNKQWFCQFCGIEIEGESLGYAASKVTRETYEDPVSKALGRLAGRRTW
jgi:hypothetical protein